MEKGNGQNKSLPNGFKVRRRTKKDPITIEGYIGIEEGCLIKGEQGIKQIFSETEEENFNEQEKEEENWEKKERKVVDSFKLKVIINSGDWGKFWSYCLLNQNDFAKHFWSDLIYPAMKELETKKGARGVKKYSQNLVNWIKPEAGFLYAFFSYWFKRKNHEWPDYFQKLVKMVEANGWLKYLEGKRGTNKSYRLTRYCVEKIYGEAIRGVGLKMFDDPTNFYRTYIQKSASKARKIFISGKSSQEIAKLAYQNPLKFIFEFLKIL